jgi:hypothetical protein
MKTEIYPRIGFQVNELTEEDWQWIEQGLREMLEMFDEMDNKDTPEITAIREIESALRKVENRVK